MTRLGPLAVLALATLAFGCSTSIQLTDGGRLVNHITRADMPSGCNLLGDVGIGHPPDAARPRTEDELITLMRNKVAELGGNTLLVDQREPQQDSGGREYFRGRGVAYACPAPEPQSTASAEEGGGEGGEDTAGGEDTSSEGDGDIDDLLGD